MKIFRTDPFHPEFRGLSVICSEGNDDDGQGGEGGGGSGGDGKDKGGDNEQITMSRGELTKLISRQVNGAISTHLQRPQFVETLGNIVGEAIKATAPPPPADDDKGKVEGKEIKKLRADAEKQRKVVEELRNERDQEKTSARVAKEEGGLTSALSKAGVDEDRIDGAVAVLFLKDKRISTNDEGKVVMAFQRDGWQEHLLVDEGVKEWLESKKGKAYLPPVDVSGSGNRGGKPPRKRAAGQKPTREELKHKLGTLMLDHFRNGGNG